MKKHGFDSEAELAAMLVEHLRETGHMVYQEVDHPAGALDVATRKGELISAFETKLSFTFAHLEQAARWQSHAHYSWVVLPHYGYRKQPDGWRYGMMLAQKEGVGVMLLNRRSRRCPDVTIRFPALYNSAGGDLARFLKDRQKDYSRAGAPGAKRWTPFKETEEAVVAYVTKYPGCNINDIVINIKHHYSSRRAAIYTIPKRWKRGLFKGVEMQLRSGIPTFFPTVKN